MATEKENFIPQGADNSKNEASDSIYALPQEPREMFNAWLFAMRIKKLRQMKELEGGDGWQEMPGVAREFHSSSPADGVKVDDTPDAEVVVFEGEAGPEVAFVERETPQVGDTELEDSDGVPVC